MWAARVTLTISKQYMNTSDALHMVSVSMDSESLTNPVFEFLKILRHSKDVNLIFNTAQKKESIGVASGGLEGHAFGLP